MNRRRSLWHKVTYACAIVVLLLPLSYLSQPLTTDSSGKQSGGKLARLREQYGLSQADLGEIDPTSEALKLVTLGMRGPAANIMWQKANEYKKTEDWMAFSAALEQIIRLQPNFINVWRFQAWNLSYNISVEFDDYHDRYYWVMKGINFIIGGTHYNRNEPRLLYDVGWFIGQKIGRADDHVQYRKLFKEDDDFNGSRKPADRDNWLVGREWYLKAQDAVDKLGKTIKGITPIVFHSYPSMSLIDHAEAIEDEGTFGEVAKNAWRKSAQSWQEFGDREVPTSYNISFRLNDYERINERALAAVAQLDELLPGLRDQIREERIAALPDEDREILAIEPEMRDQAQNQRAMQLGFQVKPSNLDVANRADKAKRLEALRLADTATHDEWLAGAIDRYKDIVNFDHWRLHCEVEQTPDALAARKAIYDGERAFRSAKLDVAKKQYDEGLAKWRAVLDAYPKVKEQSIMIDELCDMIDIYRKLLVQLDIDFPEKDFVLQDVLDEKSRSPYAPTTQGKAPLIDVTGPDAESDRGAKKPATENEAEPPPAQP